MKHSLFQPPVVGQARVALAAPRHARHHRRHPLPPATHPPPAGLPVAARAGAAAAAGRRGQRGAATATAGGGLGSRFGLGGLHRGCLWLEAGRGRPTGGAAAPGGGEAPAADGCRGCWRRWRRRRWWQWLRYLCKIVGDVLMTRLCAGWPWWSDQRVGFVDFNLVFPLSA